uniref:Ubiquitin-like protease family profile domain-containing protein n=1 Tax=Ditylenchus dipsaci TaxID=166011 RepID=A0A915DL55_9BILA
MVVSRFSIELTDDDMCRLEPGKLINDNIIDYYLQLVSHRSKQNLSLPKTIPQQSNCYDCGIFVCLFAESVSHDARPDFNQQRVKEIRRRISKEILDGVMSVIKEN